MSLQQVYSSPSGQFGRRLPATAPVQAADELLRRWEPSTSDRIRSPYGESRLNEDCAEPFGSGPHRRTCGRAGAWTRRPTFGGIDISEYVARVTTFYEKHPEAQRATLGDIVRCLGRKPTRSCGNVATRAGNDDREPSRAYPPGQRPHESVSDPRRALVQTGGLGPC
jgi:hypothetical protein